MSAEAWELVFMMLVLKLPIAYLVGVVVWAIRATPDPYEPAALVREHESPPARSGPGTGHGCPWHARRHAARPTHQRRRTASVRVR